MSEKLIDICESIVNSKKVLSHEDSIGIVARYHTTIDNEPNTLWIYIHPQNSRNRINIVGELVYRNSMAGITLSNNGLGEEWSYGVFNNIKKKIEHHGVTHNKAIFDNKTIELENDPVIYQYSDINEFLAQLKINSETIIRRQQEKEELQEKYRKIDEQEKSKEAAIEKMLITKEISKIDETLRVAQMQQEEMKNLTRFIRKQGQLRFNPILDPIQNKIKTSHLYDGVTVIINGGPGTGKTTTMIQRLKYLTDELAFNEEYNGKRFNLSDYQRETLLNLEKTHKDWIFFSPSELLKQYLSNAMNKEGLSNTNTKVQNWDDYRRKLMLNYDFFNPASPENAPFKNSRNDTILFYPNANPIQELLIFYINQFHQILSRFPKIDKSKYFWGGIARNIENAFTSFDRTSISDLVMLFMNLEINYGKESERILEENRKLITEYAKLIQAFLNKDSIILKQVEELVAIEIELLAEDTQDGIDDDNQEDENEVPVQELTTLINKVIKGWLKRYCLSQLMPSVKLTERQTKLTELLSPLLNESILVILPRIGELAVFEIYAKYTRGIERNMLSRLPQMYKSFRRSVLRNKAQSWNLDLLKQLLSKSNGKELHKQEQSLLLGFTNNLIKDIKMAAPSYELKSKYFALYDEVCRPIIGVDEATDFSVLDIYAMISLTRIDFHAVTLCGDVMQRITNTGIHSWEDLNEIIPDKKIVNMNISYRQSSLLLDVAKALYKDTIGMEADYKAYMKSRKVPKPLSFISDSEEEKVNWIEKRIKDVYKAYDNKLPSIAIFINDVDAISSFVRKLSQCDFFEDSGIKVIDGSSGIVLANVNDVRVYPISVVKGMEFDVVFFHNIDTEHYSKELTKRFLYVGLSRAAFYLASTSNQYDKILSKYFSTDANWENIS